MKCDQIGPISKFFPWREYFAPELYRLWTQNFPSRIFYSFWPRYRQKLRFGLFNRGASKWVKFPQFSPGEGISIRNLTPVVPKIYLQEGFFTHFGRPTAKNFDSVSLTKVRPNEPSFQILQIYLGLVILRCDHESNFRNFNWRDFGSYTNDLEGFPTGFFTPF